MKIAILERNIETSLRDYLAIQYSNNSLCIITPNNMSYSDFRRSTKEDRHRANVFFVKTNPKFSLIKNLYVVDGLHMHLSRCGTMLYSSMPFYRIIQPCTLTFPEEISKGSLKKDQPILNPDKSYISFMPVPTNNVMFLGASDNRIEIRDFQNRLIGSLLTNTKPPRQLYLNPSSTKMISAGMELQGSEIEYIQWAIQGSNTKYQLFHESGIPFEVFPKKYFMHMHPEFLIHEYGGFVQHLKYISDNSFIAVQTNAIKVYHNGRCTQTCPLEKNSIFLDISPNNQYILFISTNNILLLFDVKINRMVELTNDLVFDTNTSAYHIKAAFINNTQFLIIVSLDQLSLCQIE